MNIIVSLVLVGFAITVALFKTFYHKKVPKDFQFSYTPIDSSKNLPDEPEMIPAVPYPVPPIQPVQEPLPPKPTTMPEPTELKRERLYRVAKSCIGRDMSPNDVAPDSLACMESLDGVFLEAFGEHLLPPANRLSTANGYQAMLHDPRLEKITEADALPGDISIAPTGTSTNGSAHGHVGIRGKEDYMSNDSSSGLWKANYTIAAWKLVFTGTLKFPLYYFRVKG